MSSVLKKSPKKKGKGRKSKSSSDVRDSRDDVTNSAEHSLPASPTTPPSSPSDVTSVPSTSKRKKFWNSFRTRTRKLRKKKGEKDNSADSSQDVASGTTDEEGAGGGRSMRGGHVDDISKSSEVISRSADSGPPMRKSAMRRWRSDMVRTVSICDSGPDIAGEDREDSEDTTTTTTTATAPSSILATAGSLGGSLEERDAAGEGDREREEVDSGIALDNAGLGGETVLRQRQNALMEHPFFLLDVRLLEGKDLVVRDSCGTSDPYVKFKIAGKQVYKSRIIYKNLNPKWEESFTIPIEDVNKPVNVKVYDYDRGLHDDPMGSSEIDVSKLELGTKNELKLQLSDRGKEDYMGYLLLTCTLQPKTQEDKDQFLRRAVRTSETSSKKLKMQVWAGVVTIVLVEGKDLVPMDDNGLSDPYVKFRIGAEKYRTKYKPKTLNPRWLEQFDLRLFNEQSSQLEITVYDYDVTGKDDFMGRATIDVSSLETELTHRLDVVLEDGAGMLKVLLTVSGTYTTDARSDLSNYTPDARHQDNLARQYGLFKLSNISDVGHFQVKVFKACSLKAADLGGLSDPFCVLELVNCRRQTHTEYKTLNPEWNKVFYFPVFDIHSVLEVTVYDEDRDKKVEFLGKISIPLLKVKSGERRWYALKDKKLNRRSKGAILLEMDVIFNHAKAAIRTVNPAEEKLMQIEPKFKIHLLKRNIDRVTQLISIFVEGGKFLQSCFNWESKARSIAAFSVFLVMVWNFELYMLPITLLIIFLKNMLIAQIVGALKKEPVEDEYFDDDDDEEDDDKDKKAKAKMNEKEEKKSFKEKLQTIQEVCLQVQQGMDMVASLGERVKNTFNWSVPWLSTLAVVALSAGVIVLYFIPIRLLILAWGINKFTKKLRKPNAISNNELLDFLSRVPSDSELAQYRELRPELSPAPGKKKRS